MNTLKYAFKKEWYNIILLLLPFIAIPFVWSHLPGQIPTHMNLEGQVDDYSSKTFGLLFVPLLNIGLYLLFLYLPKIDPKKRIKVDQKPIPVLRTAIILFLLAVHIWMISIPLGYQPASPNWVFPAIAILFIVMGNYMHTVQPNYFIGIRVPWTLEDPENWRKTHHMASYLWVAGGLLLVILFPLLNTQLYSNVFLAVAISISLIPCIYSFYYYQSKS